VIVDWFSDLSEGGWGRREEICVIYVWILFPWITCLCPEETKLRILGVIWLGRCIVMGLVKR
jgi:hypothetical protein